MKSGMVVRVFRSIPVNRMDGGKQDRRLSPSGSVRGASGDIQKGRGGTLKKLICNSPRGEACCELGG